LRALCLDSGVVSIAATTAATSRLALCAATRPLAAACWPAWTALRAACPPAAAAFLPRPPLGSPALSASVLVVASDQEVAAGVAVVRAVPGSVLAAGRSASSRQDGGGRGRRAAVARGGLADRQAAGGLLGGVLDAVVGVQAGLVLLGQLSVLVQPGGLADHRGLVGDLDGVAPLGGVGQRHERARAAEQAGVHQGPFRLPGRAVHIDGLDLAHRLVVGGYEGQAPPGAGLVDRW
jgi:hypothetical protein